MAVVNSLHLRTHNLTMKQYRRMYPNTCFYSDEVKKKLSLLQMGNKHSLGRKLSENHKGKISLSLIGNKRSAGHKETKHHTEVMSSPDVRRRMSLSRKKYFQDPLNRLIFQERQLRVMGTPQARLHNSISHRGKRQSLESRRKTAQTLLTMPHRAKWLSNMIKARHNRPNKPESQLLELLGGSWRYTGDGSLIINGKCPDFWNGDHKVIELYGDYWHKDEDPQERINLFSQYNYDCLVIWEHELNDLDNIIKKIDNFDGNIIAVACGRSGFKIK